MSKSLAGFFLLVMAVGLPTGAILLARWARRRHAAMRERWGHWTAHDASLLRRQALERGDWVAAERYGLLAPMASGWADRVGTVALWLAIGALLVLCGLLACVVFYEAMSQFA